MPTTEFVRETTEFVREHGYDANFGRVTPATPSICAKVVNRYEMPANTILKKGEMIIEKYGRGSVMKVGDGQTEYQYLPNIGSYDTEENIYHLQEQANTSKAMVEYLNGQNEYNKSEMANLKSELLDLIGRFNRTVKIIHNCRNCGARLEVPDNCGVFHCKYCGTAYVLGAVQVRSTY